MSARLIDARCRCCGRWFRKSETDRNHLHFDCWAEHHSGPEPVWPPDHACAVDA